MYISDGISWPAYQSVVRLATALQVAAKGKSTIKNSNQSNSPMAKVSTSQRLREKDPRSPVLERALVVTVNLKLPAFVVGGVTWLPHASSRQLNDISVGTHAGPSYAKVRRDRQEVTTTWM